MTNSKDTTPTPDRTATVTLREITADTLFDILDLAVGPDQDGLVAPNAVSIAEAYFAKNAWFRAIYADETPVGFVMLSDKPDVPRYYLWRYMIDVRYQKMGFGRQAMELVIAYVRTRPNATEMFLSYVPKETGPRGFYQKLGFVDTGREEDGELEMRLAL